MGSGFSKFKKQAKEMQAYHSKMQEDMKAQEFTGTSGAGLVTITLSGNFQMKKIDIKPACVDPNDIEALQDLIQSAYDSARQSLEEKQAGANFPGLG